MKYNKILNDLTKFQGVLSSGYFISDPRMVTAVALLFEEVHFPNHLEYVIDFSKKYRIVHEKLDKDIKDGIFSAELRPFSPEDYEGYGLDCEDSVLDDPLSELTEEQKNNVYKYIFLSRNFCLSHSSLFGEVFKTDMYPESEILKVELVEENCTTDGKNRYKVTENDQILTLGEEGGLEHYFSKGMVPIVTNSKGVLHESSYSYNNKSAAALLAMQSISMMFPAMKAVKGDIILEARHKLREQLPPFWSSMLKLSNEMNTMISKGAGANDLIIESSRIVETIVRPSLIDLTKKLEYEKKDWFYKILSPLSKGLRILAGKPPITMQDMLSSSLLLGADVATDFATEMRKIDILKRDSGLVFLLELSEKIS